MSRAPWNMSFVLPEDDVNGKASGAVYVYSFNGTNWSEARAVAVYVLSRKLGLAAKVPFTRE